MTDVSLYFITSLLYAALGLHAWSGKRLVRANTGAVDQSSGGEGWQRFAAPVVLALHAALLYRSLFTPAGLELGLGNALSLIAWVSVLIYWIGSFRYPLGFMQTLVLLLAAVLALLPYLLPGAKAVSYGGMTAFRVHLVIALLAYGLFTLAALHAVLMALLERRLHDGNLPPLLRGMPSLLTMEKMLFQMILAGFILLTATLLSGIFFSERLFGKPLQFTQKNVFAFLSWGIFAALLAGRQTYGWRGRVAVRWTLAGFAALLLAYVGSKIALEVIS